MAGTTSTEKIQIVVEAITKGFSSLKEARRELQGTTKTLARRQEEASIKSRELTENMRRQGLFIQGYTKEQGKAAMQTSRFSMAMSRTGIVLKAFGGVVGSIMGGVRKLIQATKGFKMEWLSVMFISMQLNRVLGGIIKPLLEVFGIFDSLKLLFIDLLLPVMEPLIEMFFQLLDWFLNLPEPVKKAIGSFVLLGFIFTKIMFGLSQLILLVGSFGVGLGSIALLLTPFAAGLVGAAGSIKLFGDEAEANADKLVNFINSIVGKIDTFITKIGDFFVENKERIMSIGTRIFDAILEGIINVLDTLSPFVLQFISTLGDFFDKHKEQVKSIMGTLISLMVAFFSEFIDDIVEMGLFLLEGIINGLTQNMDVIRQGVSDLIDLMKPIIQELAPELGELLWTAMKAGFTGMVDNFIGKPSRQAGREIARSGGGATTAGGFGVRAIKKGIGSGLLRQFGIPGFQLGGVMPHTGLAMLHKGERIIPANKSAGTNLNVTYNVTVSDKQELMRMFRENNQKLTEEVRRITKT